MTEKYYDTKITKEAKNKLEELILFYHSHGIKIKRYELISTLINENYYLIIQSKK